jgi:hypothetical protein
MLRYSRRIGYDGVVSLNVSQGGPMIEKSLAFVRELAEDASDGKLDISFPSDNSTI